LRVLERGTNRQLGSGAVMMHAAAMRAAAAQVRRVAHTCHRYCMPSTHEAMLGRPSGSNAAPMRLYEHARKPGHFTAAVPLTKRDARFISFSQRRSPLVHA